MPYEWTKKHAGAPPIDAPGHGNGAPPIAVLHAWPYRSLPKRGFVWVIAMAYGFMLIPVAGFVGSAALWWLLVPGLIAIYGLWWFIDRSYRDGEILEALELWPDHIRLTRSGPHKAHAVWETNPYWVTVQSHANGPVPAYLTLKGGGREVELGSFLTENERRALLEEVQIALIQTKSRSAHDRADQPS